MKRQVASIATLHATDIIIISHKIEYVRFIIIKANHSSFIMAIVTLGVPQYNGDNTIVESEGKFFIVCISETLRH
jgi:hypothetical protein